jgi:acetyl-CoA carboxylase/biotin carboxylase 1
LRSCIDEFLINSSSSDEDKISLSSKLSPVYEILDLYSDGITSHETKALVKFLEMYYRIENMFASNSFEEVLLTLREGCRQADESPVFDSVISAARSFYNVENRIELVLSILDQIRLSSTGNEMDISDFLPIVKKLTELNSTSTAKVSLKAREFLLFFQMPNYTQRRSDTFDVLNSAVRHVPNDSTVDPSFDYDNVIKLITAPYAILDVLPAFFYHERAGISAIAMYTYILHTSQAYTINSVRHVFSMDPIVFEWEFVLRSVYKTPSAEIIVKREFGSFENLANAGAEGDVEKKMCSSPRRGLMCAFKSLERMNENLSSVLEIKSLKGEEVDSNMASVLYLCVDWSSNPLLGKDITARKHFHELIQQYKAKLSLLGFKRVTFMILRDNHFPRYFTFQKDADFEEDQVIRHIEPAMTYQLELHRLQEFDIEPIMIDNRRIHMYISIIFNVKVSLCWEEELF